MRLRPRTVSEKVITNTPVSMFKSNDEIVGGVISTSCPAADMAIVKGTMTI